MGLERDLGALHWSLVIPVRRSDTAKSRLADGTPELARAIALDTIVAASRTGGVSSVLVVTDDDTLEAALRPLVRPEDTTLRIVRQGAVQGLNPSIRLGLRAARGEHGGRGLAVMLGDLPALRPTELAGALVAAGRHQQAVVADHDGTGTTLLTARPGARLEPAFGSGSFARHVQAGHEALALGPESTVRADVDTRADLERATGLGLGEHTRAALEPEAERRLRLLHA
ncbi:2-phospho-L-lactate guanylyltransferase [Microterricola viridarii]|uniref:Phosphoenolpyruvate guanylyltransferase n=1 Tax=Microterricola viridarii TaxID=412690 RepID=A0A1H1YA05_9MICO|nr:2-phospho-L-lactate guanylyltransferase [Microterricola viridarii]SDT18290.1 2-phospho-L-lactate guanylyltransferase [Microterricola viridarii]